MANKPKITYLLGAWASAFAVPTIKHFQLLLEKFRLEILTKLQKFEVTEIEKQLIDDKLKLIDEISLFATVDTWARKLFLSKDPNYKHVSGKALTTQPDRQIGFFLTFRILVVA